MSYQSEFPALYAVTKMQADLINVVSKNPEFYSVDVRIDYERWIQFQTEYGKWSDGQSHTRPVPVKRFANNSQEY